jgi:hypothetical protein
MSRHRINLRSFFVAGKNHYRIEPLSNFANNAPCTKHEFDGLRMSFP